MPDLDTDDDRLYTIPGSPPNLLREKTGDAFAPRNQYALEIDDKLEPPMFRITDTHYAATWLLDPRAPKVEMPEELRVRIERMKKEAEEYEGLMKIQHRFLTVDHLKQYFKVSGSFTVKCRGKMSALRFIRAKPTD